MKFLEAISNVIISFMIFLSKIQAIGIKCLPLQTESVATTKIKIVNFIILDVFF